MIDAAAPVGAPHAGSKSLPIRAFAPAIAAVLAFAAALSIRVLNDGDTLWHVAAGQLMISRRAVIHSDPFSYTFAGAPWHTHEWLAQILLGGAFNLGGWSAVVVLAATAAGLTAWLLARDAGRWVDGLPLVCLLALGLGLGSGSLLARPHLLALPILEIWAAELIRARAEDRAPRWAFLPLMTIWANLHGSFMFGLALVAPFALEALLTAPASRRQAIVLRWGGFGLAAGAMPLLSPDGVGTLLFPLQLVGMKSLAHIGEWAPADFTHITPLEIGLLAVLFIAMTRPLRLPAIRAALLLLLLYLALQHTRYDQMLGVIGALILAEPMARAFGQDSQSTATAASRPARTFGLAAVALALMVLLTAGRFIWPVVLGDAIGRPVSALNAVPAATLRTHVLNDYSFGGYLISRGVAPYIDSRADMYGDAALQAYSHLTEPDRTMLAAALDVKQVGWTLFRTDSPVVGAMDQLPGWRRLYTDHWAVVHVRR